jgi:hypothetical protein
MCAKHVIKRAVLELTIPSSDDAFKVQSQASAFFKSHVYPMLEKVLDELDITEDIIRIEKFELDLKRFYTEQDNTVGLQKLEQQIKEKLEKIIKETRSTGSDNVISANKRLSGNTTNEELFFHILKNGILPWWAPQDKPVIFEELATELFKTPSPVFISELRNALQTSAPRMRLLKLPDNLNEHLINTLSRELMDIVRMFLSFSKNTPAFDKLKRLVYEQAFSYEAPLTEITMRSFMADLLKQKQDIELAEDLYNLCKETSSPQTGTNVKDEIKRALAEVNTVYWGRVKKLFTEEETLKYFGHEKQLPKTDEPKKIKNKPKKDIQQNDEHKEDLAELILKGDKEAIAKYFAQIEKEGNESAEDLKYRDNKKEGDIELSAIETNNDHYIKNAGLVILNPYLSSFFMELELCNGKEFNSPEAAERAAHLLQYLATGSEEVFEEHDMILNKIVCGIDISAPFTIDFILTEKEKEESKGLLDAVANNWTALKGTTGEGMRDAFFNREGILERQANGWNLKVEKTTIDVLVDKLPWGISIISMPWSVTKIFVNW